MKYVMMLTAMSALFVTTVFAQKSSSSINNYMALSEQLGKDSQDHSNATISIVNKEMTKVTDKKAFNVDNKGLKSPRSGVHTHGFESFDPKHSAYELGIDRTQVSCVFCNVHLGYFIQDQGQVYAYKIHTNSLQLQNGAYHCTKCNQPLFSLEKLNSKNNANIDWLMFSSPLSQDKISLKIGDISAMPYCANCSSSYPRFKDENGRFGVTLNLTKK